MKRSKELKEHIRELGKNFADKKSREEMHNLISQWIRENKKTDQSV